MAKVELTEKKQIKANAYFSKLKEIDSYKSILEKKQADAGKEIVQAQEQLKALNVDFFTVVDEVTANVINNKRRVIKDRIADLEMVTQMDVKGIIREKIHFDEKMKSLRQEAREEYFKYTEEIDAEIRNLEAEIEHLEDSKRLHAQTQADRLFKVIASQIGR